MSSYSSMPSSVVSTTADRALIEGRVFRSLYTGVIQSEESVWLYINTSPEKVILLYDRFIGASSGPVTYEVYDQVSLTGSLGTQLPTSNANKISAVTSSTTINVVDRNDLFVTGEVVDLDIVFASASFGNRSVGSSKTESGISIYPKDSKVAVKLTNESSQDSLVFLKYVWIEDDE